MIMNNIFKVVIICLMIIIIYTSLAVTNSNPFRLLFGFVMGYIIGYLIAVYVNKKDEDKD